MSSEPVRVRDRQDAEGVSELLPERSRAAMNEGGPLANEGGTAGQVSL